VNPRRFAALGLMLAGVLVLLSPWSAGNGWWRTGTAVALYATAFVVERTGRKPQA